MFSTELLGTLTVYCLDGNHRIQALAELEGAESPSTVDCIFISTAPRRSTPSLEVSIPTVFSCHHVVMCLTSSVWSLFCLCVFSSHSCLTPSSLDVPAGVTQEEGHIGFIIHLSAVRASIFIFFVLLLVVVVDYRLYLQHHLFCFHSRGTSIL